MVRPTHVNVDGPFITIMEDEESVAEMVSLSRGSEMLDLAGKFCAAVEAFDIAKDLANGASAESLRSRAKDLVESFRLRVYL